MDSMNAPRILHLSNSDKMGGAQRAAYWLIRGLLDRGIDCTYLVDQKLSHENWIFQSPCINPVRRLVASLVERIFLILYPGRLRIAWSNNLFSRIPFFHYLSQSSCNIVNLHWVGGGLLSLRDISLINRPLVISLYDMWFFTGGCHYTNGCTKYLSICTKCPHLSSSLIDLSTFNFLCKLLFLSLCKRAVFVVPSTWMLEAAKSSKILSNATFAIIPHGTDCSIYKPHPRDVAKTKLGLDTSCRYILFACTGGLLDHRKGYQHLDKALSLLHEYQSDTKLLFLGPNNPLSCGLECAFQYSHLHSISDDALLSLVYAACDLVVTPSGEEAFGMTASEALCCGTPVVAFAHYGPLDVVDHKITGYLAEPYNHSDFAQGIRFVLDHHSPAQLSTTCRSTALARFSLSSVAQQYSELYSRLLHA
jgi:glycosyltransferase involved in cell wall biosynthesis